jgi:hypothetical protein
VFISESLLERSIEALHDWYRAVPVQSSRHIWSLLPPKFEGARIGESVPFREEDDKVFLERFFEYGEGQFPYFDPFARTWLPAGYWHSNAATFRKKTFRYSWQACSWDDETLVLHDGYPAIFEQKVLTKGGVVTRVPAWAAAVWFFKRPGAEWEGRNDLAGLPESATAIVELFRSSFGFDDDDDEWDLIFDPDASPLEELLDEDAEQDGELSASEVSSVCERLSLSTSEPVKAPALSSSDSTPETMIDSVDSAAETERLRLPPGLLKRIVAALAHSNVRLMGAPGTGKSTIARLVLQARQGDEWDFALATSQWTTEDVVGGPVPDPADPRQLIFQPGIVLAAAEAGRWVGIDEINRADIDAAFGELFSLLAGFDTTLPYVPRPDSERRVKIYAERPSGELDEGEYGLPPDWRMIATMNSWDKASLARVSFAFSRRWCTVYVPVPDPDDYEQIVDEALARNPAANTPEVSDALKSLFVVERDEAPVSLRSLGYALGPAIALSCVKDITACVELGLTPAQGFQAAVEGFVLPQFEGEMEAHDAICAALWAACDQVGLTKRAKHDLGERLEVFTGRRAALIY